MARITNGTRSFYKMLVRDEADESQCYYCGQPGGCEDFTPAPGATDFGRSTFTGEWTRTNTCLRCWKKIYTANIANAGGKFGVQKGCMSVLQKEALLGAPGVVRSIEQSVTKYHIGFDPKIVAPAGLLQSGSEAFMYGTTMLHREEVMLLQGALALRMIGAPDYLVEGSFSQAMNSDNAVMDHIDLYRTMLGLPEL